MIKISNLQLQKSVAGLTELGRLQLPVKASYAVGKNLRKLQDALDDYRDTAQKILASHAKPPTEEQKRLNRPQFLDQEAYRKDIEELNKIEIEIDIHMIKLSWITGTPGNISPGAMADILWFIDDDTTPPEEKPDDK